ncbi:DinB family protein [Lysobacter enzymogenes]|uniref:DinB family protein n=1 Tax=Lysobacter enzymogenes TaxID=69 RepID=UPI001A958875|nr:DinB family protein [Lysobacter enzymogenes]QQP95073.1 DinB family protein [Lysobacter enzymogenes]
MNLLAHTRLMADYNRWMNQRIYAAAARLPAAAVAQDRGAFFGSILGTLNHLMVADKIWLHRFATHPSRFAALDPLRTQPRPTDLRAVEFDTLPQWRVAREQLDAAIVDWAGELSEADLDHVLAYANTKGVVSQRRFGLLLLHFFNHQTHHRGQITTLLTQAGEDVGGTDLLELIPALPADASAL